MRYSTCPALCLSILSVLLAPGIYAGEPSARWPAWRGADARGSSAAGSYVAEFGPEKNLRWKVELPGRGCSTPIVWDGRVYVTCGVDGKDRVAAYDGAKGTLVWEKDVGAESRGRHRNGSGSNPSLATDGEVVAFYFKSGNFGALSLGGELLWSTNLQKRYGDDTLYWDIGTSPVLVGDLIVIAVMHEGDSFVAGFDKSSGDLKWKETRKYECPTEGDHSYTTPIVIDHEGRPALVVWGAEHVTAHDASDGKLIWSCGGFNPDRKGNWVTVASPVVTDGMVVIPFGRGNRLIGVKLGGKGDVTKTHFAWRSEETGSFCPTPAAMGGQVFVLKDRGSVDCVDPKSGDIRWSAKFPKHRSKYYSSPTVADGKLYAAREDGVVVVLSLDEDREVIAQNDLGEQLIASPVPVDDRLYIRGAKTTPLLLRKTRVADGYRSFFRSSLSLSRQLRPKPRHHGLILRGPRPSSCTASGLSSCRITRRPPRRPRCTE